MAVEGGGSGGNDAGANVHGFPGASHRTLVEGFVRGVPGRTAGAMHGGGVIPSPDPTPGMHGYGEVTSGQKGHPGTD